MEKCPKCSTPVIKTEASRTLVGYGGYSHPHDHDDNCVITAYKCEKGHIFSERRQNVCPVGGCDWKGKIECFCHPLGVLEFTGTVRRTSDRI